MKLKKCKLCCDGEMKMLQIRIIWKWKSALINWNKETFWAGCMLLGATNVFWKCYRSFIEKRRKTARCRFRKEQTRRKVIGISKMLGELLIGPKHPLKGGKQENLTLFFGNSIFSEHIPVFLSSTLKKENSAVAHLKWLVSLIMFLWNLLEYFSESHKSPSHRLCTTWWAPFSGPSVLNSNINERIFERNFLLVSSVRAQIFELAVGKRLTILSKSMFQKRGLMRHNSASKINRDLVSSIWAQVW